MTVGDIRKLIDTLPDNFAFDMESNGERKIIQCVSLEPGRIVLRDHMLSIQKVVDTFTAHDGSEYVLTVERISYPNIIQMNVNHQIEASLKRFNK